jgi:hypothetical protein
MFLDPPMQSELISLGHVGSHELLGTVRVGYDRTIRLQGDQR